jgi:CheY-like chemotaxis protein
VDDDEELRASLVAGLASEGYHAVGAANGEEALAHLRRSLPPAVIILDLAMPTMNGWQFREIQKKTPGLASVPVVVMTANGSVHAAGFDAEAFLRKPVTLEELLAVLRRYCPPAKKTG